MILTADQRFLPEEQPTAALLLGEWCRAIPDTERVPALAYHWDDRTRLYRDFLAHNDVYERALESVTGALNEIHRVEFPLPYWRIVIGPWLTWWSEILLDRFQSIQSACASGLVTETRVALDSPDRAPNDVKEYAHVFVHDAYNHLIYSDLVERLGLPYEDWGRGTQVLTSRADPLPRQPSFTALAAQSAKRVLRALRRLDVARRSRVVIVSDYLSTSDMLRLQLRLKQIPMLFRDVLECPRFAVDPPSRGAFALAFSARWRRGSTPFEDVLGQMIADYIPRVYVEGYRDFRAASLKFYPMACDVILTGSAHMYNEAFKLWAAESTTRGSKLVITQHGGHYGSGLWSGVEEHEIRIADRYFSWGWRRADAPHVLDMPSPQIERAKRRIKADPTGRLLWVGATSPRYAYRMFSVPTGPAFKLYIDEQLRFGGRLRPDIRRRTTFRPNLPDYEWHLDSILQDRLPDVTYYRGSLTLRQQAYRSRLFVGTYNATTYLEALAADCPTVLFWNPTISELRPEAEPYFERLREARVLWYDPEDAARHVNEIFDDPGLWWRSAEVQAAKGAFCHRFARSSPSWDRAWASGIDLVMRSSDSGEAIGHVSAEHAEHGYRGSVSRACRPKDPRGTR